MSGDGAEGELSLETSFRTAISRLASGVAIVTVFDHDDVPRGLTVTSLASYSLEPPSVLVSIDRTTKSYPALLSSEVFAVHLLAEDQAELAKDFAQRDDQKFDRHPWRRTPQKVPVIEGVMATFICRHITHFEHGDHSILVGEVTGCDHFPVRPLVYFDRRFLALPFDLDDPP